MNRVAHDGMRVRAHAGAASFRRRESLKHLMQDARAQVDALKQELSDDPGAGTRRVRAARQRAASEREQRIQRALQAMDKIDKNRPSKGHDEAARDGPAAGEPAVHDPHAPSAGEQGAEQASKDSPSKPASRPSSRA